MADQDGALDKREDLGKYLTQVGGIDQIDVVDVVYVPGLSTRSRVVTRVVNSSRTCPSAVNFTSPTSMIWSWAGSRPVVSRSMAVKTAGAL